MAEMTTAVELPREMGEALAGLLGHIAGKRLLEEKPERLPMDEQKTKLLNLWDRYNTPSSIKPGDLVRMKDGLGILKDEVRPQMAMLLWRMLDPADFTDQHIVKSYTRKTNGIGRVNCIVAYICDDGHCLVPYPADINELEPA